MVVVKDKVWDTVGAVDLDMVVAEVAEKVLARYKVHHTVEGKRTDMAGFGVALLSVLAQMG